jgi:predicted MFS family arabinose efflux permease
MSIPNTRTSIGSRERLATRMLFFIGGFGASAWASIVPFAKARASLDEATLGMLLLSMGTGSIIAMPITGPLVTRHGCRKVLIVASVIMCAMLPLLAVGATFPVLATALFVFGAGLGCADCAFNIQAIIVERAADKALMSGFHGFYSVGGIFGAASVSALLSLGTTPLMSTLAAVVLMLVVLSLASRGLLPYGNPAEGPPFAIPKGIVLFLGVLCCIVFLAEGAMLDWCGVFLTEYRGMQSAQSGFGFASFALAMTAGRLTGDSVVNKLGPRITVAGGGALAVLGIVTATLIPSWEFALAGFALVGLGCSNIVPVLFSAVGRQRTMPQSVAVPAITTLGYAGVLAGPAGIGFIAHHSTLVTAFLVVAALMAGVAISSQVLEPALRPVSRAAD